ncbi:hypothetical protein ES703_102624 [subsurface metagenome]
MSSGNCIREGNCKGHVATAIGSHIDEAQEGFTLPVTGRITLGVGEKLQSEFRIGRAVKRALNSGTTTCGGRQDREVLQVVRTGVAITCVIRRYAIGTQVDPQASVGEYGIRLDSIADANLHDHPIAAVEGNGIAHAGRCPADGVVARIIQADAVVAVRVAGVTRNGVARIIQVDAAVVVIGSIAGDGVVARRIQVDAAAIGVTGVARNGIVARIIQADTAHTVVVAGVARKGVVFARHNQADAHVVPVIIIPATAVVLYGTAAVGDEHYPTPASVSCPVDVQPPYGNIISSYGEHMVVRVCCLNNR